MLRSGEQGRFLTAVTARGGGARLPPPLEVDGLLSDVVGGEGLVVLRGDPVGCALLCNGFGRWRVAADPLLGPEVVDTERQKVAAQVGRADRLSAAAVHAFARKVGGELLGL